MYEFLKKFGNTKDTYVEFEATLNYANSNDKRPLALTLIANTISIKILQNY